MRPAVIRLKAPEQVLAQMLGSALFGGTESAVVCGIQIMQKVQ